LILLLLRHFFEAMPPLPSLGQAQEVHILFEGKVNNAKGRVKQVMKGRKRAGRSQPRTPTADPKPDSNSVGVLARDNRMREAVASV